MKLRRLREKLHKLKSDYQYSEDEEETEKSEMETLKDLKKATEQAIRELQVEAAKANKRKGLNIYSNVKVVDQLLVLRTGAYPISWLHLEHAMEVEDFITLYRK